MIIIINPTSASKCPIIITAIIIASLRAFRAENLRETWAVLRVLCERARRKKLRGRRPRPRKKPRRR